MDITAIGEVLIDLTQQGLDEAGIPRFAANPGGAPANLAVAAARLGASTAFIGRVGQDAFGAYLRRVLTEQRVDISGLAADPLEPTTLAVVMVDHTGERSFTFYRDPGADTRLSREQLPTALLLSTRCLHFGSVSLTAEPSRDATFFAVRTARGHGAIISYDPNYRAALWPDEATAVRMMKEPLSLVDVLKVSEEELPLLTGTDDLDKGASLLMAQGIRVVFITLGPRGAYYALRDGHGLAPGVSCTVADTNGAGDTFFGAALSRLMRLPSLDALTLPLLRDIAAFSNRAASITASRHGAIPAMPSLAEVEA